MDNATKKSTLDKVASMSSNIAYPDELLNDSKLEEVYDGLKFNDGDYFHSILNWRLFNSDYYFSKLRKPVNNSDWVPRTDFTEVNAAYLQTQNSIGKFNLKFYDNINNFIKL